MKASVLIRPDGSVEVTYPTKDINAIPYDLVEQIINSDATREDFNISDGVNVHTYNTENGWYQLITVNK